MKNALFIMVCISSTLLIPFCFAQNATESPVSTPSNVETPKDGADAEAPVLTPTMPPVEPTPTPKDLRLFDAIKKNNLEEASNLLNSGLPVNDTNSDGMSPLMLAIRTDNFQLIKTLVDKGADVKFVTYLGQTPLQLAATRGQLETTRLLLEKGVDVNAKDEKDLTALLLAIPSQNIELIKALLAIGVDVKAADKEYANTALHTAAFYGNKEICALLIEKNADVNAKNLVGKTPLHLVCAGFYPSKAPEESKLVETAAFLIEKGADMKALDINENTPLHDAVLRGRKATVEVLISTNPPKEVKSKRKLLTLPNIPNSDDKLPVDIAVALKFDEIAALLTPLTNTPTPEKK